MSDTLERFLCRLFTYLAARRCTISSSLMFDWVYWSNTVLACPTSGRTRVKYALSLMAVAPMLTLKAPKNASENVDC